MKESKLKHKIRRHRKTIEGGLEGQELIDFALNGKDYFDSDVSFLLIFGYQEYAHNDYYKTADHGLDERSVPKLR